jgi:hypothetical protein
MEPRLAEYALYLTLSLAVTAWVGTTLYRKGRLFLVDVFRQEGLADSVNHLLVVGFYLVNLGVVALLITADTGPRTPADVIQAVVGKVGVVLLILGGMHFMNLFVLHRIRRPAQRRAAAPPPPTYPQPQQPTYPPA